MAYTVTNYQTKKALKDDIAAGKKVSCFQPNADLTGATLPHNGRVYLEGPHYPKPHKWYAQGELKDGYLVKVK